MEKRQFFTILRKYQESKLTKEDRDHVDKWFDSFGYSTDIEPLRDAKRAKQIRRRLNDRLQTHIGRRPHRYLRINRWLTTVAACSLFAVLAWLGWLSDATKRQVMMIGTEAAIRYDTLRTETGKMKQVELPDHTVVWLNANTQIRYSSLSFGKDRTVFLDYGEAFFEVTENPDRPFVVRSNELSTTVLGTSFNVKDYPKLDYASVIVKTGKVVVSGTKNIWKNTFTAGMGVQYDKERQLFTANNQIAAEAGSWRDGKIQLTDATFDELALIMYNRFNIKLKSQLPAVDRFRYTMTILQNKPITETMELICQVHQTNYRRTGNEITMY